jgi:hypothetical protein
VVQRQVCGLSIIPPAWRLPEMPEFVCSQVDQSLYPIPKDIPLAFVVRVLIWLDECREPPPFRDS